MALGSLRPVTVGAEWKGHPQVEIVVVMREWRQPPHQAPISRIAPAETDGSGSGQIFIHVWHGSITVGLVVLKVPYRSNTLRPCLEIYNHANNHGINRSAIIGPV